MRKQRIPWFLVALSTFFTCSLFSITSNYFFVRFFKLRAFIWYLACFDGLSSRHSIMKYPFRSQLFRNFFWYVPSLFSILILCLHLFLINQCSFLSFISIPFQSLFHFTLQSVFLSFLCHFLAKMGSLAVRPHRQSISAQRGNGGRPNFTPGTNSFRPQWPSR